MGQCVSACRKLKEEAQSDPDVVQPPAIKAPRPPPLPVDDRPASYVDPPSPVAVAVQAGGHLHKDPSHQW